ncbi:MAG: HAD-IIB family hydrolase [Acidobacteria bacterium]|nr:HAD-IIB family hydrolase [Acidobacteriota bacterium]
MHESDRVLLCCDLDRTLLPNGPQEESPQARPLLRAVALHPELALAYVSGRSADLIRSAMEGYDLPQPHFAVGDVGTTIYRTYHGEWEPVHAWEESLEPDWAGATREDLAHELAGLSQLRIQPDYELGRFKLSYFVDSQADLAALGAEVEQRLGAAGVHVGVITSYDESGDVGLLDVLPAGANKLHALRFLIENEGFPTERTVFAGDSGNDLAPLASEIPAVLVRNARDEVRNEALRLAREAGHETKLHLAQGGLLGLNGNYSAGALEGLDHFVPQARQWLAEAHARLA